MLGADVLVEAIFVDLLEQLADGAYMWGGGASHTAGKPGRSTGTSVQVLRNTDLLTAESRR